MTKDPALDHKLSVSLLHPRYWPTWFSIGLLALLAWLPVRLRDALAASFANLLLRFSAKQCYAARLNIKLCFPELTQAEREAMLYRSICIGLKGFFALGEPTFLPASMFLRRIKANGWEHVETALQSGKPIIFMIPHTWTIDACGLYFTGVRLPMCTMMHSARNPVYDWFLNRQRVRFGGKVYERSAGLKPIIKDMRNGYHFFYLPDQDHGHEASVFVPLFGVPKATLPALPKLAKLSGAIVLPVLATYNESTYCYELQIRPAMEPYPTSDLMDDVRYMNAEIEMLLKNHPAQYMWFLKYFRSMPDGSERSYRPE
ncbi:lauroyl-Kdo(2)-lipid IV(A) myristoyltransferase [Tolumonas lignilytica]|jgi:lipid A biosynthesis (KDO)2-(lauroyl)-lipid IVA acyltransferase|uniref:lauroyl-Kdo(2)-lipid IV(A) myristoyltransferase n=1 Tax=Tolumonas lignilytica TaxID=1283284 RepID=UPI0004632100|nr:lauroyl-Kdo(2)-lipid IV(A) myristoyltransferase [Tolumonas lignilytica]